MITRSPHKQKQKSLAKKPRIDNFVYVAVVIGPVFSLPQLYTIWFEEQKGVSIIAWTSYLIATVIWLFYAIKHKDRPLILVQSIWIVLDLMIIIGVARLG